MVYRTRFFYVASAYTTRVALCAGVAAFCPACYTTNAASASRQHQESKSSASSSSSSSTRPSSLNAQRKHHTHGCPCPTASPAWPTRASASLLPRPAASPAWSGAAPPAGGSPWAFTPLRVPLHAEAVGPVAWRMYVCALEGVHLGRRRPCGVPQHRRRAPTNPACRWRTTCRGGAPRGRCRGRGRVCCSDSRECFKISVAFQSFSCRFQLQLPVSVAIPIFK